MLIRSLFCCFTSVKMVSQRFEKFLLELSQRVDDSGKLQNVGSQLGLKRHEINGIKYNKDRDGE